MSRRPTYPGGISAVLAQWDGRRDPIDFGPGEALPAPDIALDPLTTQIVADPDSDPGEQTPSRTSYAWKRRALRREFTGQPELCFLNGLLITCLRKRAWPDSAAALFQRLWAEQGAFLLAHLNPRWLVSSATTFGDAGVTLVQRSTGLALTALFGTMKLYEAERLYSGQPSDTPHTLGHKAHGPLPLEMDDFSLTSGGLDVNLLARLWQEAEGDATLAPLAHHLIDLAMHDDRTVFRRLRTMRTRKERRKTRAAGATARWGLVTTIKAPLDTIERFAAHHLDQGAGHLYLYLDDPTPGVAKALNAHPQITATNCDADYWQALGERPDKHQVRQIRNAQNANRSHPDLDWLAHIDVDEFLMPRDGTPIADTLATLPDDAFCARVRPVESLAPGDGTAPGETAFKSFHIDARARTEAGARIYPEWGRYLPAGMLSHVAGKLFFRTGRPGLRIRIHNLTLAGQDNPGEVALPQIDLCHMHAPTWDRFLASYRYRLTQGAYRADLGPHSKLGDAVSHHALFSTIEADGGERALRAFYDEVCLGSRALCDRLEAEGLMRRYRLNLDALRARYFPT